MEYTKEQLNEAYRKLPEGVKETLATMNSVEIIKKISEANRLHIDQMGKLADEITLVTLGLSPAGKFLGRVQQALGVDASAAENITVDVNRQIFSPIQDQLKQPADTPPSNLPTKEEVLAEIESPSPGPTVFEQKMSGSFGTKAENKKPEISQDPYLEPTG